MELSNLNIKNGLCISLGANIDSKFGDPITSLLLARPRIEKTIKTFIKDHHHERLALEIIEPIYLWSSLYETNPQGVEEIQPDYINTLLLVKSDIFPTPSYEKAKELLKKFKDLEAEFGRQKNVSNKRWLSRCLDIDILWWENLLISNQDITLPHPRFTNRNFVITPLSEVLSKSQKIKKLKVTQWVLN